MSKAEHEERHVQKIRGNVENNAKRSFEKHESKGRARTNYLNALPGDIVP